MSTVTTPTLALHRSPPSAFSLRRCAPYAHLFVLGYRQTMRQKLTTLGRVIFLAVLLLVFSSLWRALGEQGSLGGVNERDFIWYLALTEWTALALPHLHLLMEKDFRSGDFACQLPRPVSYVWGRVAEQIGVMMARMAMLFALGVPITLLIAGGWPSQPEGLLMAIPLGLAAGVVSVISIAWVGLSAAILQDADAMYWLWQKFSFLLGGLLVPLTLYPEWVMDIAKYTPFYSLLYGVGRQALGASDALAWATLGQILLWGGIMIVVTELVYRRVLRIATVSGG